MIGAFAFRFVSFSGGEGVFDEDMFGLVVGNRTHIWYRWLVLLFGLCSYGIRASLVCWMLL